MADFQYFLKLIEEIIELDKLDPSEPRLVNDLVDQCKLIAQNSNALSNSSLNDRYHDEFYREFLSIGLTLTEDFTTTYKSGGRLLNNLGYDEKKGNKGHKKELPVLLAWYFWKSADCNREQRFNEYEIDWTSAENAETVWFPKFKARLHEKYSSLKKPTPEFKFNWSDPHKIIEGVDDEAIDDFRKGIGEPKKEHPKKPPIKRDWIDPYNLDAIPFVGREEELRQLDEFAGDGEDCDFKIWVMVAPSGAGKTRLTREWISRPYISEKWQTLYLGLRVSNSSGFAKRRLQCQTTDREVLTLPGVSEDGEVWTDWSPNRPHIFIIDYVFGFGEIISGIIERCKSWNLTHPVRLLVLDHKFPEELDQFREDSRWSYLWADGERISEVKSLFHNEGQPLDLSTPDIIATMAEHKENTEAVLRAVIKSTISRPIEDYEDKTKLELDVDESRLDEAIEYLAKQPNAQYPLFAALVGDAIRRGKDFSQWSRRELAQYYLSGRDRLPWENEKLNENDRFWASSLICTTTVLRGLPISQIRNWTPSGDITTPNDLRPIIDICERVVSRSVEAEISPFEPDFVGETFFLLYLNRLRNLPSQTTAFYHLLSCGSEKQQEKGALEFLAFVERLSRNLLNDDQSLPFVKQHWRNLRDFLHSTNFAENVIYRWAACAASFGIFNRINESKSRTKMSTVRKSCSRPQYNTKSYIFFQEIDEKIVLYTENISPKLAYKSSQFIINYYKYKRDAATIKDDDFVKVVPILLGHDSKFLPTPVLHQAIFVDFAELAESLILADCDIYGLNELGSTALMVACFYGQEKIALLLIEKMKQVDQQNSAGMTALIFACYKGGEKAALALVEKMDQVDHQTNDGLTALMFAIDRRLEKAALALINKTVKVDHQTSDGFTLLMFACHQRLEQAALALIEKMDQVDHQTNDGFTALMFACRHGLEQAGLALIEKIDQLDQPNALGQTALGLACTFGTKNLALALISRTEQLDHQDQEGQTALINACRGGGEQVALALIEKMDRVDHRNKDGSTALMYSCLYKYKVASKELIEKMTHTDQQNKRGETALMFACRKGMESVALTMIPKMDRFDHQNCEGYTALMFACTEEVEQVAFALISKMDRFDHQDNRGRDALMHARQKGQRSIAAAIMKKMNIVES